MPVLSELITDVEPRVWVDCRAGCRVNGEVVSSWSCSRPEILPTSVPMPIEVTTTLLRLPPNCQSRWCAGRPKRTVLKGQRSRTTGTRLERVVAEGSSDILRRTGVTPVNGLLGVRNLGEGWDGRPADS